MTTIESLNSGKARGGAGAWASAPLAAAWQRRVFGEGRCASRAGVPPAPPGGGASLRRQPIIGVPCGPCLITQSALNYKATVAGSRCSDWTTPQALW